MANNTTIHIKLFGNLTIFTPNSEPVEIPPSRAGALLALMALEISSKRAFPREEIVDLLWPEDDADVARHKLRQTLYDVRRLIAAMKLDPDQVLIATRNSLQLNPDCVSVDAAVFEAELRAAALALNPSIRSERLALAVDRYKGELLPGFYQDRFITEKTRLEEAYHGALKSLVLAYEATEQYDRGIEFGRKLLSLNPLNEEAHFALMRLYAATGQPSLVLRQYQDLERTLKDELGEAPSRSAQRLMESLRETALERTTERGVGASSNIGQTVGTEEIASEDPTSRAASAAKVSIAALDQRSQAEPRVLRRNRMRWALAALPPAVLCVIMLVLILVKRHNTAPKTAAHHAQTPALTASHATVLARYKLASDERGSEPTAITTDYAGNLLVGGFVETTHNDADFITLKYDPSGRLLWSKRYDGSGHDVDRLRCIAVDAAGDVYVSGESDNGHGNGSTRLSGLDVVTIKYSADGKKVVWQDRYNDDDDGEDHPVKMVVDSVANTYVLCNCRRLRAGKDAGSDFVLIKYSAAGTRLWRKRYDGESHGDNVPTGLALVYQDSGVCVCGYSRAAYKTGPEYDYVTIKYSADGKFLWTKRYGAGNMTDDYARDLFSDQDGNVYVIGEGRGLPGTPDESRTGCIMVKYSPFGEQLWARGTVKESDRLQRVTAAAFWADGFAAVAGPVIGDNGTNLYRVVLRDADGSASRTEDYMAPFHPVYAAPCAVSIWPEDTSMHDAVWISGSQAASSGPQLVLNFKRLSRSNGSSWSNTFSPANNINAARAAVRCHRGKSTVVVVAALCIDNRQVGGITLVEYTD